MRRVLHGDVSAVACALYQVGAAGREALLARLFAQAAAADAYRKRHKSLHPVWGDGSLMSVALNQPHSAEPFLDEPDYAVCMSMVFNVLAARAETSGA